MKENEYIAKLAEALEGMGATVEREPQISLLSYRPDLIISPPGSEEHIVIEVKMTSGLPSISGTATAAFVDLGEQIHQADPHARLVVLTQSAVPQALVDKLHGSQTSLVQTTWAVVSDAEHILKGKKSS